jgi:hypothetical protein
MTAPNIIHLAMIVHFLHSGALHVENLFCDEHLQAFDFPYDAAPVTR